MAAKKDKTVLKFDGKAAAAGDAGDAIEGVAPHAGASESVFDGPLSDEDAIEQLVELNHERNQCALRWENAKNEASDAKKELDNASNAISQLIDRIDRQRSGLAAQPVLRTLEAEANPASL